MTSSDMIECPECERRVDQGGGSCPHCGAELPPGRVDQGLVAGGSVVGETIAFENEEGTWEGLSSPAEAPPAQRPAKPEPAPQVPEWLEPQGTAKVQASPDLWPTVPGEVPARESGSAGETGDQTGGGLDNRAGDGPGVNAPPVASKAPRPQMGEEVDPFARTVVTPAASRDVSRVEADESPEEISEEEAAEAALPAQTVDRIRRYEKLVAENPSKASPYILLGKALEDAGFKERAIGTYEKLLAIEPHNQTAHMRLGVLRGAPTPTVQAAESLMRRAPSLRTKGPVGRPKRPRAVLLGIVGIVLLAVATVVLKAVYFPGFFRPVSDDLSSSRPVWSPDGTRIAVLTAVRSGDIMATSGRFTQTTLAIVRGNRRGMIEQFDTRRYGLQGAQTLSWAPDGKAVIVESWDEEGPAVYHLDLVRKAKKRLLAGSEAEYSRDGSKIVYVSAGRGAGGLGSEFEAGEEGDWGSRQPNLYLYLVGSGEVTQLTQDGGENPRLSPDGRTVLYEKGRFEWRRATAPVWAPEGEGGEIKGERDYGYREVVGRDIHVLDISTGEDRALTSEGFNTHGTWVGRDGKRVSYAYYGKREAARQQKAGEAGVAAGTGDKEGSSLRETFGVGWRRMGGGDLRLTSARGGEEKTVLSAELDHVVDLENVSWSPDGSLVAFEGLVEAEDPSSRYMPGVAKQLSGNEKTDIFFSNSDGSGKRRFQNKHSYKRNPKISPDGKTIAYELMLLEMRLASFDYATEVWVDRLP